MSRMQAGPPGPSADSRGSEALQDLLRHHSEVRHDDHYFFTLAELIDYFISLGRQPRYTNPDTGVSVQDEDGNVGIGV